MEYSEAGENLIHEKNQKQKISWHCPFKTPKFRIEMKGMLQGEYCLTPGCVKAAKALINNMDPSVDPCVGMLHVFCMAI